MWYHVIVMNKYRQQNLQKLGLALAKANAAVFNISSISRSIISRIISITNLF